MDNAEVNEEQKSEGAFERIGWITAVDLKKLNGYVVTIVGQNISKHQDEETQFHFVDGTGAQFRVLVAKADFKGFEQGTVVEITGRVLSDHTILLQQYTDWGHKANMVLWGKLLKLTQKFPGIF